MFGDESVCVSSHNQDLAVIHLAVDGIESEGETGKRVHGGNYANTDFSVGG
jgi:hypothetical protein